MKSRLGNVYTRLSGGQDRAPKSEYDKMAWSMRGNYGPYFYLSVKVPGREHPVTRYLGKGAAAHDAAQVIEATREHQKQERQAVLIEKARTKDLDALTDDLRQWSQALAAIRMAQHGFRQHRGEWRHHREKQKKRNEKKAAPSGAGR
jgi:hypothetical protein